MGIFEQQPLYYSTTKKFQFMAAGAATFGAFGLGTAIGWSSPVLSYLKNSEQFVDLTKGDKSWIGAILTLGALFSGPVTGYLIGKVGRRTTMMIMSAPFLLGWLLIIFANSLAMMLAGRFLTGFAGGSFSLSCPVYIGEISEGSIRGILGSAFQFMTVLGVLFSFSVGALVNWVWLSIICAFVPVILLFLMMCMPESPRYLLMVEKRHSAAKSLAWFRGAKRLVDVEQELEAIQESVNEVHRNQATFRDLLQPSLLKPTLISLGLMLFQQMSGINAVIFFTQQIFVDAGSTLSSDLCTIIVGFVQVLATMASMCLVDRLGRKCLLIFSDVGMAISLVALATFFQVKYNQEQEYWVDLVPELNSTLADGFSPDVVNSFGWLPLLSLLLFITAFSLGFGPIPWLLIGEILPPRALGLASSISTSFNWTLAFLVTIFFESIKDAITIQWAYFSFAIICGIGVFYVVLFVPETKGRSLSEIQAFFGRESECIAFNASPNPSSTTTFYKHETL